MSVASTPANNRRTATCCSASVGASSRSTRYLSIRNRAPFPSCIAATRPVRVEPSGSAGSSGKSLKAHPAKCAPKPGSVAARRSASIGAKEAIPSTSGSSRLSGCRRPRPGSSPGGRAANQAGASSTCTCGCAAEAGRVRGAPGRVLAPSSAGSTGTSSYRACTAPVRDRPDPSARTVTPTGPADSGTSPWASVVNSPAPTRTRYAAAGRPTWSSSRSRRPDLSSGWRRRQSLVSWLGAAVSTAAATAATQAAGASATRSSKSRPTWVALTSARGAPCATSSSSAGRASAVTGARTKVGSPGSSRSAAASANGSGASSSRVVTGRPGSGVASSIRRTRPVTGASRGNVPLAALRGRSVALVPACRATPGRTIGAPGARGGSGSTTVTSAPPRTAVPAGKGAAKAAITPP